jgi:predicted GIY-YIG superfamily endonuclease
MIIKHQLNGYWTKEKCHDIALLYKNRSEFRKNNASAYRTAIARKWLNDICSHMSYVNEYWNYEKCKIEALKQSSKTDFQKKAKGAHRFANKNGFLDDICSHMIKIGNQEFRCIYAFEFEDNYAYIGLTYNISNREFDHNKKGPVFKHIIKTNSKYKLVQLTDYIRKKKAQQIEELTIKEYENDGWKLLNKKRISTLGFVRLIYDDTWWQDRLGGSTIYWTYEKCKEEALKYKHKTEFKKGSGGAFTSSLRNGWYEEICSHMIFNAPKNHWKDNEITFLLKNYYKGVKYCIK